MIAGAWICLLAPLAGAIAITLAGNRISRAAAGVLATGSVAVSFAGALLSFFSMLGRDGEQRSDLSTAWTWLGAGDFQAGMSILVDPLSVFMMLVVSGVGALIVGYSIGYMRGEDEERRFFAYMALFVFSMLLLVESGNLLLLLAGWGMVGLCSYLLIGFNQERPAAIAAAKKAFVMNAIGDGTIALALFLLIQHTRTLDYAATFARIETLDNRWVVNLIALGLLGGAVAKSAQLPLQTWLPDAMEGPTPVSALIHAATMVTAGVYLIVRVHPLFEAAPNVQDLAAGLGAATLLLAGLIALVQTDIKRVIAYSTMSQIGYMFLGAGLGAYANAMFHLMTHAFFKALLFLAAGIVIHALASEQDMRRMGGLAKLMPFTRWMFLIGSLALVGLIPFSGFFSKDSILASALDAGWYGVVLFAAGIVGTLLTGLYTFRMYWIVFGGSPTPAAREQLHAHTGHGEGPRTMLVPVAVLGIGALVAGWIQFAPFWHPITSFLNDVAEPLVEPSGWHELTASALAMGLGLVGMGIAWIYYGGRRAAVPRVAGVQRLLEHKFYFDEAYDLAFYRPVSALARFLMREVEAPLVHGTTAEVGDTARFAARRLKRAQTGLLRTYILAMAGSLAILAVVFVVVR
ncbi:MAG: NADH-quinone oxidoreductase subunit L [Actinomycetota bacterium]|nr:NADH-quinone oxidoreductase subunit L [Actinomycetota bacterium]